MIQTNFPVVYGNRNEKEGIIMVEVRPLEMTKEGQKYLVIDWDISLDPPEAWFSKEVFYSKEKIQAVNDYLEVNHDFTGLSKVEAEMKKIQLGLMLDTQTNLFPSGKTIHNVMPEDWILTPETTE